MKAFPFPLALVSALLLATLATFAEDANGLAPEVVDLSPKSISWAAEKLLPDLEKPYISSEPGDLKDGIPVGKLANSEAILKLADEIASGEHGDIDSDRTHLFEPPGELVRVVGLLV